MRGSFLDQLGPTHSAALLARGVRRSFGPDEMLHRQGDPASHVFIVVRGWCRVSATNLAGQVSLLALRGPGDVLGDLAAINGWPRTASVATIDLVEVMQLTGPAFVDAVLSDPDISLGLLRNLSVRLQAAHAARIELASLDVSRRLARHLLRLAAEHGATTPTGLVIEIPLTQQDLADRLGSSRRAVSRALGVLRDRGAVVTLPRKIVLRRTDVLRALAGSLDPDC